MPEIELVKALRATGWGARWPDTYGKAPPWMSPWKRAEVPKAMAQRLSDIRSTSPQAKPWDAVAWRGDEVLFVECKGLNGRQREPFTKAELRFIWAASRVGVGRDHFAVLLGAITYPER